MEQAVIIEKLRAIRSELAKEGIAHIAMFGSRARGDNRSDSDLDLLVEVDRPGQFSLLNLVGVEQIVSDRLGVAANVFMRRSLDTRFRQSILSDVIEIF